VKPRFDSPRIWIYVAMIVLGMIWGIRFIYLSTRGAP
jgi:hypothetical protein